MRHWLYACAAIAALSAPASAQAFHLQICNQSQYVAKIALLHDDIVEGWGTVLPGRCISYYYSNYTSLYVYADNALGQVTWAGHDLNLCVAYPGPFKRKNYGGYKCKGNERLRGFRMIDTFNHTSFIWTLQ